MIEAVGQDPDAGVAPSRSARTNAVADRMTRLRAAHSEAVRRSEQAERDLMNAEDGYPSVAASFLLGEASEEDLRKAEDAIDAAARERRRWRAAVRELDDDLGIIRDSEGVVLSRTRAA